MPTLLSSLQIEKTLSNARKPSFDLRGAIMMTLEGRTGELRLGVTIRSKSQTREQKNGQALLRGEAKKRWREPPSIWTLWHKIEFIYRTGSVQRHVHQILILRLSSFAVPLDRRPTVSCFKATSPGGTSWPPQEPRRLC
ncbi:hypothetical protein KC320_g16 [Hortaea werneckii]|nr:hypothetical protein KC320_g16 [Hortaea werneckii]